jgi:hypothetical protein
LNLGYWAGGRQVGFGEHGVGGPSKPRVPPPAKLLESINTVSNIPILTKVLIIERFLLGGLQIRIFPARAVSLTKEWPYVRISGFGTKFSQNGKLRGAAGEP